MVRKQFIAGARCPHCNTEDKVRFCREDEREWIECVACGQVSERPPEPEHPQPQPEPEPEAEAGVSVVRLQPGK